MPTSHLPEDARAGIDALIAESLAPQVERIDREGRYPGEFLRALGERGGFGLAIPQSDGGAGLNLAAQIEAIAQVARTCGSTAFLTWCQATCAWYLRQSGNTPARQRYLARVARGELLSGTGMSNTVKHLAGIERINLRGRREGAGYRVNGVLPWVSNLGDGHLVIVAAALEEGGYILFAVPPESPARTLRPCPAFSGMEGTGTVSVRLANALIPDEDVLAGPDDFEAFMQRIKPGFVLMQVGIALGIVQASVDTIAESNSRLGHVNQFLDDQEGELAAELVALRRTTAVLALAGYDALPLDILRTRAQASELALKATQSAALHAGAVGYLMTHPAQRRLREALFVAIVTPALKHLRKEIHALEQREAA